MLNWPRFSFSPWYSDSRFADQITALRAQRAAPATLFHVLGTCTTATIMYFLMQANATPLETLFWFGMFAINLVVYAFLYVTFYRYPTLLSDGLRRRLNILIMLMFGMTWSTSPWLFISSPVLTDIFILNVTIFIMSVISGPALSMMTFTGYVCFFSPMLMSASVHMYWIGTPIPALAYVLVPLLWISIFAHTLNLYKMYVTSFQLELEKQEALEKEGQANEEKTRFIAAASHDIRQPLQAIHYLVESLKQKSPSALLEDVHQLEKSTESMSSLLEGLLDISKLDAGVITPEVVPTSLVTLIDRLCHDYHQLAAQKSLVLRHEINSDITVMCDPVLLERMVSNLISNAIKYTDKGEVILGIEQETEDTVLLTVTDTGMGIEASQLEAIYQEFYQINNPEMNQAKGLGLGLAIVKRLATMLDIPLKVRSQLGAGSTFSMTLRRGIQPPVSTPNQPHAVGMSFEGINILLVDDNDEVRQSLGDLLASWGANVVTFSDFEDCVQWYALHTPQVDMLLTDYRLPNNRTGSELINALYEIQPIAIPCAILSGDVSIEPIPAQQGITPLVLHKPIKPAMLKVAIMRAVKSE